MLKKLKSICFLLGLLLLFFTSCDKKNCAPSQAILTLDLAHHVDGNLLVLDTLIYLNDAGNTYSITDFKYYLSDFKLISSDGKTFVDCGVYYVDVRKPETLKIKIDSIPPGKYDKIFFSIGLLPSLNTTGSLPNTLDNINMAWPISMDGGYHFMKMEGKFKVSSNYYGFAFHLGKNVARIDFEIPISKNLIYWNENLILYQNINEWFRTPTLYNLETDECYIMNNDSLIQLIKLNGSNSFQK